MGFVHIDNFCDELLCKDIRILTEFLSSMSNSYRLLVGAAEEFNSIALVHRHEAEEAIERADELGDIIDDVERELKKLMKLYLQELMLKVEIQQLNRDKICMQGETIQTTGTAKEDSDKI